MIRFSWIVLATRCALGIVFLYAGVSKLHDLRALSSSVASFDVLPISWVVWFASSLPFYEAIAGFWLLLGWRLRVPALAVLILCVALTGTAAQAYLRGLTVSCACFGEQSTFFKSPLAIFARALVLAAMAGVVYCHVLRTLVCNSQSERTSV